MPLIARHSIVSGTPGCCEKCQHPHPMTPRQTAILNYHRDVSAFGTSAKAPVFVILDVEDSVGFEIASNYQPNCSAKRDAIKETGAYPAFTLTMTIQDANALLAHGWPNAKKTGAIPEGMVPVILISEERCVAVFVRRE